MKVNSMYFDRDSKESMYKFIRLLNEMSYDDEATLYNDIHIKPEDVDDLEAHKIAREVKEKIEANLKYPGTIKITVIRETRATEEAK